MPLYLDEIWLTDPTNTEQLKQFVDLFTTVAKNPSEAGVPSEVKVVAGPWISNEEAKLVMVIDIPDHSKTFPVFMTTVAKGLVEKRRLQPLVDWNEFQKLADSL